MGRIRARARESGPTWVEIPPVWGSYCPTFNETTDLFVNIRPLRPWLRGAHYSTLRNGVRVVSIFARWVVSRAFVGVVVVVGAPFCRGEDVICFHKRWRSGIKGLLTGGDRAEFGILDFCRVAESRDFEISLWSPRTLSTLRLRLCLDGIALWSSIALRPWVV